MPNHPFDTFQAWLATDRLALQLRSGLMIIIFRPFKLSDFIQAASGL